MAQLIGGFILFLLIAFACAAFATMIDPTKQVLPTVAILPTNVEVAAAPSETPTQVLTASPSPVIPTATATITDTAMPTKSQTDLLTEAYAALPVTIQVDVVNVTNKTDGPGYFVYNEATTLPGANFAALAEQMQQAAFTTLVSASLEFNVIFTDGTRCEDHTFDNRDDEWRVTVLTCPDILILTVQAAQTANASK